jgi:hypothetical protein
MLVYEITGKYCPAYISRVTIGLGELAELKPR